MRKFIFLLVTAFLVALQPTVSRALVSNWTLTNLSDQTKTSYMYSTFQGGSTTFNPEFSGFLGNTQVKYLGSSNLKADTNFNFIYDSSSSSPWITSLTSNDTSSFTTIAGYLRYRIKINNQENGQSICSSSTINCGPYFGRININSASAINNPSVLVYQAIGDTYDVNSPLTNPALTLFVNPSYSFLSPTNDLIVIASWDSLNQPAISLSMSFTQVPAPLPLMATATFLGTFGKIRRLSGKLHPNSRN